jgi:hypothetical protein
MDKFILLLIVVFILFAFLLFKNNELEKKLTLEMFNNSEYLADVQAIRTLSKIADGLQKDGYTVPGNLIVADKLWCKGGNAGGGGQTHFPYNDGLNYIRGHTNHDGQFRVNGKIATNGLDPNNMPDGWGGGIRTLDIYSSGSIVSGPDGKSFNAGLNSGGGLWGLDVTANKSLTVNGNSQVNGNLNTSGQINCSSIKMGDWEIKPFSANILGIPFETIGFYFKNAIKYTAK